jgi:hypothetical protein
VYYPEEETLEVHWLGNVSDLEILNNMEEVTSLFTVMSVKKYVVNLLKTTFFNFPYQKNILEKSVKAFHQGGGKKITIVNKKQDPRTLFKMYKKVMNKNGIKLNLISEQVYTSTSLCP